MTEKQTDVSWQQISDLPLYETQYKVPGFPCRSLALRGPDGWVLYNPPLSTDGAAYQWLLEQAPVLAVIVPSNFHTLGARSALQFLADPKLYADVQALPRLRKNKVPAVAIPDDLDSILPAGANMTVVPHQRYGEVWMTVASDTTRALIVCDAFFNFPRPPRGRLGRMLMRLAKSGPGLSTSQLLKWVGIRNRPGYFAFATRYIQEFQPDLLVPSHGAIQEQALAVAMATLQRRFG